MGPACPPEQRIKFSVSPTIQMDLQSGRFFQVTSLSTSTTNKRAQLGHMLSDQSSNEVPKAFRITGDSLESAVEARI